MKAILLAALLLLTALAVVPAADAAPPEPQCMPVYQRTDVGTISIVRKDSCSLDVYECPYEGAPISSCEHLLR
ncbi:MAG: hypothetical protein AABY18_09405 [Candidatus Thermoplasmatota archaeon]